MGERRTVYKSIPFFSPHPPSSYGFVLDPGFLSFLDHFQPLGSGIWLNWAQILAHCRSVGKLFNLSKPQSPYNMMVYQEFWGLVWFCCVLWMCWPFYHACRAMFKDSCIKDISMSATCMPHWGQFFPWLDVLYMRNPRFRGITCLVLSLTGSRCGVDIHTWGCGTPPHPLTIPHARSVLVGLRISPGDCKRVSVSRGPYNYFKSANIHTRPRTYINQVHNERGISSSLCC